MVADTMQLTRIEYVDAPNSFPIWTEPIAFHVALAVRREWPGVRTRSKRFVYAPEAT